MKIEYKYDLGNSISPRPGWMVIGDRQEFEDLVYSITAALNSREDKTVTAKSGNYSVTLRNRKNRVLNH